MKVITILSLALVFLSFISCSEQWKPAKGPLFTKWVNEINPNSPFPEYPRPQLVRSEWQNLNGLWDYVILPIGNKIPDKYEGIILVPYPVESALSGVMKDVGKENNLWYRKEFEIPSGWNDKRVILNFGAVDWEATLWINGKEIGSHKGGYDSFSFDISDAIIPSNSQELVLKVWDPTNDGTQPRGKQVNDPHGIWYTPVTGIWQTVWLEPVANQYIEKIKLTPDIDSEKLIISANVLGEKENLKLSVTAKDGEKIIAHESFKIDDKGDLKIANSKLWSPENPFLYDLEISLLKNENVVDKVESYFGMRKIALEKEDGISKIYLNNSFYFQIGPLDQGWWPDGLYTAPVDEAMKYDVEVTKQLGFNMARKHVKVEPARWYYWCDKLGLLVWQDMPSGDEYIDPNEPDFVRSEESAEQFEKEWKEIITQFYNSPAIVTWVPFNEGWGQYDTERIVDFTKNLDPTRLVINTSGWADRGVGDINDMHAYPGPNMPEPEKDRAVVLGEFGGLGLPLEGHTWQSSDNWGYRSYENQEELTDAYIDLIRKLQKYIGNGLSAAVYTQTSDVEVEVNGLMTYDRSIIKMDSEIISKVNNGFLPPVFTVESNIFLTSASVELSNEIQKGEIYYTTDGSDPDLESNLYNGPIVINSTSNIKARTYWSDKSFSSITEKKISKVDLISAVQDKLSKGIKYKYFEDRVNLLEKLPNFDTLDVKSSGLTEEIDLNKAERDNNFAILFEGYINVPSDGIYTFYLSSDDGSQMLIHDELVVDNDFTHGLTEKFGQIALQKGNHSIKVSFFQGEGGKGLEARIKGPGIKKQFIPSNILFH